jgi:hypothetical protein
VSIRHKAQKAGRKHEFQNRDAHDGMDAASIPHLVVCGNDGAAIVFGGDGLAPRI